MKKTIRIFLFSLFCLGFAAPEMLALSSPDTLVFKRKITYGGQKVRGIKALKPILETAHDVETMRLFQNFKTTNTLGGVFLLLGGVVGIVLLFVSRSKLKKTVRRFNDIKMGRAAPSVSLQNETPLLTPQPSEGR